MSEKCISFETPAVLQAVLGSCDENLLTLQREYHVVLFCRGADVHIGGEAENCEKAAAALKLLGELAAKGQHLSEQTVRYVITMVEDGEGESLRQLDGDGICITTSGKVVRPKTVGQKKYVDQIRKNTIVLGVGPAGTGKTYLAVALAVRAFKAHEVQKIILTRPAVEAGEKLGFLPGDLTQKDLGGNTLSGLEEALKVLKNVEGIGFAALDSRDVVRHPLVMKIVQAYENYEKRNRKENNARHERRKHNN